MLQFLFRFRLRGKIMEYAGLFEVFIIVCVFSNMAISYKKLYLPFLESNRNGTTGTDNA
jgi:hypothetical protein